jgi:hypothetical protein
MIAAGVLLFALVLLPVLVNSDVRRRIMLWASDLEPTKSRWKDQEEVDP